MTEQEYHERYKLNGTEYANWAQYFAAIQYQPKKDKPVKKGSKKPGCRPK